MGNKEPTSEAGLVPARLPPPQGSDDTSHQRTSRELLSHHPGKHVIQLGVLLKGALWSLG